MAINMYKNLGYIIYRTIIDYYSGEKEEDAYGNICINLSVYCWKLFSLFVLSLFLLDMRKALSRDVEKKSVIPYTQPVRPEDIDAN